MKNKTIKTRLAPEILVPMLPVLLRINEDVTKHMRITCSNFGGPRDNIFALKKDFCRVKLLDSRS